MDYRREIDGLRAVAVAPVIFFHAGFELFEGGFVGVDIFFVISGYLITSILIEDLEQKRFSLLRFYERRARRILPALFLVVACSIPFSFAWMSPSQLGNFAESVIAVVFFGSNFLFWREDSYFGEAAELKPLLHTWSLAVEEQYYLLFPLFLLFLWIYARPIAVWVVAAIAVFSLALSEWAILEPSISNAAVFYLAPTRAWELLAGSLCAFILSGRQAGRSDFLGLIGIGMIVGSILFYDKYTPFPSVYALLPVGGTVLIILFASAGTLAAKLLGMRIMVGIGLISYSAYLWHQPLFAFARLRSLFEPSNTLMFALSLTSFGLAYLTWQFVETPFRNGAKSFLPGQRAVFGASAVAGLALAGIGVLTLASKEAIATIYKEEFAKLDQRISRNRGLSSRCNGFDTSGNCRTSQNPEILVWGDSYAMHIVEGLIASDMELRIQQFTKSNCAPILGISFLRSNSMTASAKECIDFNENVFNWLNLNETVEYVVFSSPFSIVETPFLDTQASGAQDPNFEAVLNEILETIDVVEKLGRKVVIFSPTPLSGYDIGQCAIRSMMYSMPENTCDFNFIGGGERRASFILMEKLALSAPVVRLDEMICPEGICDVVQDGALIFQDRGHLSKEGSTYLGLKYGWADLVRLAPSAQ